MSSDTYGTLYPWTENHVLLAKAIHAHNLGKTLVFFYIAFFTQHIVMLFFENQINCNFGIWTRTMNANLGSCKFLSYMLDCKRSLCSIVCQYMYYFQNYSGVALNGPLGLVLVMEIWKYQPVCLSSVWVNWLIEGGTLRRWYSTALCLCSRMYFGHLTKRLKSRFGWISPPLNRNIEIGCHSWKLSVDTVYFIKVIV